MKLTFLELIYMFNISCEIYIQELCLQYGFKEQERQKLHYDKEKTSYFGFFLMGYYFDKKCFVTMYFVADSKQIHDKVMFNDVDYEMFFKVDDQKTPPHYIEDKDTNNYTKYLKYIDFMTGYPVSINNAHVYEYGKKVMMTYIQAQQYIEAQYMLYIDYISRQMGCKTRYNATLEAGAAIVKEAKKNMQDKVAKKKEQIQKDALELKAKEQKADEIYKSLLKECNNDIKKSKPKKKNKSKSKPIKSKKETIVETNNDIKIETIMESKIESKIETIMESKIETIMESKIETIVESKIETIIESKINETNNETIVESIIEPIIEYVETNMIDSNEIEVYKFNKYYNWHIKKMSMLWEQINIIGTSNIHIYYQIIIFRLKFLINDINNDTFNNFNIPHKAFIDTKNPSIYKHSYNINISPSYMNSYYNNNNIIMDYYLFHMEHLALWFQEAEQLWAYSDIYFDSHIRKLDILLEETCNEYGRYWQAQENISIHVDFDY